MAFVTHTRLVNPRLGTYYGIFAAGVAALFLMLLIFEQLGAPLSLLRLAMLLAPIAFFIVIGLGALTSEPLEFFAAGRRVPAVFNGLVMAMTAFGSTGIVVFTGVIFAIGFDALCLVVGAVAGFVVMAIAIAPFLRKFGAYSVPSYLGRRLASRGVRLTAASVLAVPMLLIIAAEVKVGALAASWLTQQSPRMLLPLVVMVLLATVLAGGMRSQTWAGVAQVILALLALAVPAAIVGVYETNLPIPQLSHGPALRALGRREFEEAMAIVLAAPIGVDLPGPGLGVAGKRFASAFGSIGTLGFTFISLTVMAGVAAAPWLLPRVTTVPTVYDARKSLGWATFFFGVTMMTVAAVAVFVRIELMDPAQSGRVAEAPYWLRRIAELGWAQLPAAGALPKLSNVLLERDAVLFVLPVSAGMPDVLLQLALAGAVAAALAAAAAAVVSLGHVLAEDVCYGLASDPLPAGGRMLVARLSLVAAGIAGGLIAIVTPADPLLLLLWALVLSGSAGFPVLMLSIWWKRLNAWGAIAGLAAGFATAVLAILAAEIGAVRVHSALASVLALPVSLITAMLVARLTPQPDRSLLDLTQDLRVPGGETVFDREMRLTRLRQRQRG